MMGTASSVRMVREPWSGQMLSQTSKSVWVLAAGTLSSSDASTHASRPATPPKTTRRWRKAALEGAGEGLVVMVCVCVRRCMVYCGVDLCVGTKARTWQREALVVDGLVAPLRGPDREVIPLLCVFM